MNDDTYGKLLIKYTKNDIDKIDQNSDSNKKTIIIASSIAGAALLGGLGYWFLIRKNKK